MSAPIRKTIKKIAKAVHKEHKKAVAHVIHTHKKRPHPEYGTSKLEERFAKNFLDKLGVKYVYQFKAESIGRYFDFYLPDHNTCIEVDGDYYHSYGKVYEDMSPMQKHNKRVDEQKNQWCMWNNYKLIRIWEHDINQHSEKVMEMLKDVLYTNLNDKLKQDNKKKRH